MIGMMHSGFLGWGGGGREERYDGYTPELGIGNAW